MQKYLLNILLVSILSLSINTTVKAQDKVVDQIIAIVGDNIILQSDIENQYLQLQQQGYYSTNVDIKCQILEDLLYQKLLLNQAKIDSIEVSDNEVESTLDQRIEYFIQQAGSKEKLEELLNKSLLEIKADFKDLIKDQMLVERMQSKITADIKITPSEVRSFFNELPSDSLPVIDKEFELQQIVKYPPVNDQQVKVVKDKLNEFIERVKKGDKFSTLAVLYSEDPGTAKNGGELGFVGRGDLVPEFAAVAFNLKVGEISRIVETEFGYHIIQLIERKGERINVRHILLTPKISANDKLIAKNNLDSIHNQIFKNSITFEEAATKFSEDKNTKNNNGIMVNPVTGGSKFTEKEIDPAAYYKIINLKVGEMTQPFETKDERGKSVYKFIKLKSKTESHKVNLKDDYKKIQDLALAKKKQDKVNEWIKKKQETTYIKIDDSYKFCDFNYGNWIK